MIRRILLVAVAAAAVVLVPSVAMAYNAPGYSSSVSDSTPVAGQSVTITVQANPNEAIRLVVTSPDGVKTFNGTANASGVATFTFAAPAEGTTTIQAFNAAGKLVSDQTLNVAAAGNNGGNNGDNGDNLSPTGPTDNTGNNTGNNNGDQLSDTGFNGMGLAAGGGALVLAGAGAVVVAKRRRSAHVAA